jgi:hypothetical protein
MKAKGKNITVNVIIHYGKKKNKLYNHKFTMNDEQHSI